MNKKIILSLGIMSIIIFGGYILTNFLQSKTTIEGEFKVGKGCVGVVNGILLPDFKNRCDEAKTYEGKTVKVTGDLYEPECTTVQCFDGPSMTLESIEIVSE